jgi:acetolactate synthase-1/2/3 large subunit
MATHSVGRTGGQILVDQLKLHCTDLVFCVPGESFLSVLDALYDVRSEIRLIVCRQEGGAAYMAEAYGKLTGRPGVCFVTRGPGASNACIGVHSAYHDSTPMILFVGQVARSHYERQAFQEVDLRRMYSQLAKWVAEIEDARRIPEFVGRAFSVATSGRPGPVVLALPEDMLRERVLVSDAEPYKAVQAHPGESDLEQMRQMLARAQRPIVILGGSTWNAQAVLDITAFAEKNRLPVATTFRRQDRFDNLHHCYAGDLGISANPKLITRIRGADLLIAVGTRLGEAATDGYRLLAVPRPVQKLIHAYMGAEELGRVYHADLPINTGVQQFAAAARALAPVDSSAWAAATDIAHREYLDYTKPIPNAGQLQLGEIIAALRQQLPPETIVCNGAGNYSAWVHRFWHFRQYPTQLAPASGSMGYGVPAAVAAAALFPQRPILSFSGDGCFLMNGQEIATAMQYGLKPIFFVINNGMYGTIRMHQELSYPYRVVGTTLTNPDFAALGRAYGLYSETVESTDQFPEAFARARRAGRASLIELRIDPEAISPLLTLSKLRERSVTQNRHSD